MTGDEFAQLIHEYTRTNSTTLPLATIALLGNAVKDEFAKEIIKADEDLFGVPATRDLVATNTTDPTCREYTLPEDVMKIKYVEARLNGTDWLELQEFDLTTYRRTTNESEILSIFGNEQGHAFFDVFRKSLWLYSGTIVANSAGLKLWYIAYPGNITTTTLADTGSDLSIDPTTTTAGMPRQFHELWARRISILWKGNREKPIPLTERELTFKVDFKDAMSSIRNPNLNRDQIAKLPNDLHLQY